MKRYVLLDRDGTVIEHVPYLHKPEAVRLIDGAALKSLCDAGLGLVLVTNQSGVGRGMFAMRDVHAVHRRLEELLEEHGVRLDGIYVCPHAPWEECGCRKPAPGMAQQAARELGFDLATAFMVGDADCDAELGQRIGAHTQQLTAGLTLSEACRRIVASL